MRLATLVYLLAIPAASAAQDKVSYRNVALPERVEGATAIEFTLDLPDTLAASRVRAAGERRKLDVARAEPGSLTFSTSLPGICDTSKGVFLERGQRPPSGPCNVTYVVTWSASPGGTTFRVSAVGYMSIPGRDVSVGGAFTPGSSRWNQVRQLSREIAGERP